MSSFYIVLTKWEVHQTSHDALQLRIRTLFLRRVGDSLKRLGMWFSWLALTVENDIFISVLHVEAKIHVAGRWLDRGRVSYITVPAGFSHSSSRGITSEQGAYLWWLSFCNAWLSCVSGSLVWENFGTYETALFSRKVVKYSLQSAFSFNFKLTILQITSFEGGFIPQKMQSMHWKCQQPSRHGRWLNAVKNACTCPLPIEYVKFILFNPEFTYVHAPLKVSYSSSTTLQTEVVYKD